MIARSCSACGVMTSDFYTKSAKCKPCQLANNRAWAAANRAKVNAAKKAWREANPVLAKQQQQRYRARNPQRLEASRSSWIAKDPDHRRQVAARYYHRHHDVRVVASAEAARKGRETLSDNYIKALIQHDSAIDRDSIPPALIEAKRIHIQIKRFLKNGHD